MSWNLRDLHTTKRNARSIACVAGYLKSAYVGSLCQTTTEQSSVFRLNRIQGHFADLFFLLQSALLG